MPGQALGLGVGVLSLLGGCGVRGRALVLLGLEVLGLRDTGVGALGQLLRLDLDGDGVGPVGLGDGGGGGVGRILGSLGVRRGLLGRGGRLPGMGSRVIGVLGGVVRMGGRRIGRITRIVRRTGRLTGQFAAAFAARLASCAWRWAAAASAPASDEWTPAWVA